MKKLLLMLAMVAVAATSYGQGKFKITASTIIRTLANGTTSKETIYPNDMHMYYVGDYITITDQAHSIYKSTTNIIDKKTDEADVSSWYVTDEKDNTAYCTLQLFRETSKLYFTVTYSKVTFIYDIENED